MFQLLDVLLTRIVQRGALLLTDAQGKAHRYGDGQGRTIAFRLADKSLE